MVVYVITDNDGGVYGVYSEEDIAWFAYDELLREGSFGIYLEPQRQEVLVVATV